jgi:hypothetical protein
VDTFPGLFMSHYIAMHSGLNIAVTLATTTTVRHYTQMVSRHSVTMSDMRVAAPAQLGANSLHVKSERKSGVRGYVCVELSSTAPSVSVWCLIKHRIVWMTASVV